MQWYQKTIQVGPKSRGCHLITTEIIRGFSDLAAIQTGLLHIFLQHTSASLSINENACADVRVDLEMAANRLAPEGWPYSHTAEGPDDMPAHVKSSLFGCQLSIPINGGRLLLGTWQGIYLNEHRNDGGKRSLVLTAFGSKC